MSGKEINKRQNESKSLQYLAAQRQIYSEAKTRMNVQIALIVLPPIAICFLKELCIYNTNIVACVILLSFIILVFDRFYLSEQIKEKCCRAAKIQELFDSYVLDIVWNNSLCGSKEEIYRYVDISAEKYKQNKGVEMLKNWYPPEIKSLRGEKARLQCQKINVFWDREIRQSFLFFLICGAIVYIIFVIGALIYHNMNIAQGVIFSSASIAPVFVYVINMIRLNIISEMKLERLRGMFEGGIVDLIEKNDINANIVEKNTRCLQDAIFKHRCSCLPVWDFFYSIQKDNQEKRMTSMMRRMGEPSIKC